eukprot:TRINITY_DN7999_c1_g1_i7.p2 TRINITY_DN7999_c1_g1~~TRINITY_DN7999_c1_g1_i7.p2  ORF type:complete len:107 (-),score=0.98 TRINITY_DN7999_c1_g1_i7:340-660(-)
MIVQQKYIFYLLVLVNGWPPPNYFLGPPLLLLCKLKSNKDLYLKIEQQKQMTNLIIQKLANLKYSQYSKLKRKKEGIIKIAQWQYLITLVIQNMVYLVCLAQLLQN